MLRKYIATAKMLVREQNYFGIGEQAAGYVLRLVSMLCMLVVWRALFMGGADMEGMTLRQMLAYTVLSSVLSQQLDVRTQMSNWLHEGTILSNYLRPMGVFGQIAATTVGRWIMPFLLYSAPVAIVCALTGLLPAPDTGLFYLSVLLAVSQGFAVDYLFSCLLIRMRNVEWTVVCIRNALNVLLTGALIHFAALPWGLGRYLSLSPFGTMAGAPLALYTGLDAAARLIPAQIFWNLALWPLAIYWFKTSREKMISFGG